MSSDNSSLPGARRPRVLCHVQFLTWVPSDGGRINTTDKHVIGLDAWVDTPGEASASPALASTCLGEQAIQVIKTQVAAAGIEWLGLVGLTVSEQRDTTIVNQPARSLSDRVAADTGLKLV